jgi:DNA-binding response OmpR family regulator
MKILVVEDDEKLNTALKLGLEKEGYAVDGLLDGKSAEKRLLLNHSDYDLLILDLSLPEKSGIEVCRSIREKGISLPVLILTGHNTTADKVNALDTGADDYLTKPFSIVELSARVRALMRRPVKVEPSELRVRDIILNPSTRKVVRDGSEIPLTLKEYSILEYLMHNPNQVITRDQLLDHVWDFNFDSFSNIVDVHITNLRKKINADGHENCIETIRGVGYRLKV